MKVLRNIARCRICFATIESQNKNSYETCSCGAIAISGGNEKIIRHTRTWGDLEELSEYLLTWRDVLDCKQWHDSLNKAADNAVITGHMFFVYDEDIYRNLKDGRAVKTGKTINDLNNDIACTVPVNHE